MLILSSIKEEFERTKPFANLKISMSIHLEARTAYLARVLCAGGAEVWVTGCNSLSTQNDVAAALAAEGFEVHAIHGVIMEGYEEHLKKDTSCYPDLIIDDGGDLISLLHGERREYSKNLTGGCEESTTGIHRLLSREKAGLLDHTMIDVNDADCKRLFDNRRGTGQSILGEIMSSTSLIIASKTVVIASHRWCKKVLQCA